MSFSLGDYVTVNDRLKAALEKFPDLRVIESEPKFVTSPDGKVFVEAKMTVYRTWDDVLPMVGFIWEEFPGTTPYTIGAEQPNSATSVLGRILGYMGFGITKSIASKDDVTRREPKKAFTPQTPKVSVATYPNGDAVPDPFTGQPQMHEEFAIGDATKGQMGKIRGLGRGRGLMTNPGLYAAISVLIGRTINALDHLTKKEASHVIESWMPQEPEPVTVGAPADEEPF